jgi:hypothetical protein
VGTVRARVMGYYSEPESLLNLLEKPMVRARYGVLLGT